MIDSELQVKQNGFTILNDLIGKDKIDRLEKELLELKVFDFNSSMSVVNLLKNSKAVNDVANDLELNRLIANVCDQKMFPVKAFVLDKTMDNNWEIPWHQDLKIAVERKVLADGYTNWSLEAGIIHAQPPVHIMERLITVRIHFDSNLEENGAIHVIPGSHKKGIINSNDIQRIVEESDRHLCLVDRGGIMIMKPLILHYSPPSNTSARRRILQLEYGFELDKVIEWHAL